MDRHPSVAGQFAGTGHCYDHMEVGCAVCRLRAELEEVHRERDEAHAFATEVREALGDDYAGPEAHWRARSLGSIQRLRARAERAEAALREAREDARRLKGLIQCLDLGASNRNAYASHAMLCDAEREIGPCNCGYDEVAAVMTECSACPRPAVEDGLCDPCHGIAPAKQAPAAPHSEATDARRPESAVVFAKPPGPPDPPHCATCGKRPKILCGNGSWRGCQCPTYVACKPETPCRNCARYVVPAPRTNAGANRGGGAASGQAGPATGPLEKEASSSPAVATRWPEDPSDP